MKIAIGMTVELEVAKLLIKEIVQDYELTLLTDTPIILLPDDDRAIFFVEIDNPKILELLEADEAIDVVWYNPEFHTDLNDVPVSGNVEVVSKLEKLLQKDADPNG